MALACVSLLASQLSGLHMHVNADGYAGTPQGTHTNTLGEGRIKEFSCTFLMKCCSIFSVT